MIYANHVGNPSLIELLLFSIQLGTQEPIPGAYEQIQSLVTNAIGLENGSLQVTGSTDPDALKLAIALRNDPSAIGQFQSLRSNPVSRDMAAQLLTVLQDSQSGSARLFAVA